MTKVGNLPWVTARKPTLQEGGISNEIMSTQDIKEKKIFLSI